MANTIRQQLAWATALFEAISDSARLDSEILLAHCLKRDRSYLMTWPERELDAGHIDCFHSLVQRRLEPQPVAYLVGSREFYSLQLETTPTTLVPRPETELLVEKSLQLLASKQSPSILELGTGTGAIALALKQHCADCRLTATDINAETLEVARRNATKHGLEVEFIQSDWYRSLDPDHGYDLIVSNPPYIAANDPYLSNGDLPAEPRNALCSGESGLEALEVIIRGAVDHLQPGGWLVLEHGYDQQQQVQQLLLGQGFDLVETFHDFNNLPRVSVGCTNK